MYRFQDNNYITTRAGHRSVSHTDVSSAAILDLYVNKVLSFILDDRNILLHH